MKETKNKPTENHKRIFAGIEFLEAFKKNYPSRFDGEDDFGFVRSWMANIDQLENRRSTDDRFSIPERRTFSSKANPWCGWGNLKWLSASLCYKGLINLKTPFDLVLYTNLIWELRPKTILEFGSLQGGSGLWFADQLQSHCEDGEVHSFDILEKCIHPRAKHPRLHFHTVDLENHKALDMQLLAKLPHPWLVVDDAHVNLENLVPLISGFMKPGDYYVWEDLFTDSSFKINSMGIALMNKCDLVVDTKYTDAFGTNVTCSPNAWLVKHEKPERLFFKS